MKRILVICTGNSCRSQMAEGFFKKYGEGKIEAHSAGIEAHGLNPVAVAVMSEAGIDISGQESKAINRYDGEKFDAVITVCDDAQEACPYFPGAAVAVHHDFPDPARATGPRETVENEFRKVRDMIGAFVMEFIREHEKG